MRTGKATQARRTDIIAWAMFGVAAIVCLVPGLPVWSPVVAAALPFAALVMLAIGKGHYRLVIGRKRDQGLQQVMFGIPLLLMLSGLTRFDLIDWKMPIVAALPLGIGYALAARRAFGRTIARANDVPYGGRGIWIGMALFGMMFGWGLFVEIDGVFDRRPPALLAGRVTGKYLSGGRYISFHLTLVGDPAQAGLGDVRVTRALYRQVTNGAIVCVAVHPGALGARWYDVGTCR